MRRLRGTMNQVVTDRAMVSRWLAGYQAGCLAGAAGGRRQDLNAGRAPAGASGSIRDRWSPEMRGPRREHVGPQGNGEEDSWWPLA